MAGNPVVDIRTTQDAHSDIQGFELSGPSLPLAPSICQDQLPEHPLLHLGMTPAQQSPASERLSHAVSGMPFPLCDREMPFRTLLMGHLLYETFI